MKKIISLLLVLGTFTSNAWADVYTCRLVKPQDYRHQVLSLNIKPTEPLQVVADVVFIQRIFSAYTYDFAPAIKFNGQFDGRVHRLHNGVTIIALSGITTSDYDGTERWSSLTMSETTLKNGIIERKLEEKRISSESRLTENIQWTCKLMNQK